jgi:hypothetical protein
MAKKFNGNQLNKLVKPYEETKRVFIDKNEEFYIDIKPNFKPTDVQDVIESFFNLVGPLNMNELDIDVPKAKDINKINIKDNVFFLLLDAHAINRFSNLNLSEKESYKYIQMLLNLINLPDDGFNKIIEVVPAEQWTDLIIKYFKYQITIAQTINAVDKIKEQKEAEKSEQPINVLADNKVEEIIQEATEQVKAEESNGDI